MISGVVLTTGLTLILIGMWGTLTHRNIVANMLQAEAWYQPALSKLKPGEVPITGTALPLYHIFALTVCAMMSMRVGGKCLLIAL